MDFIELKNRVEELKEAKQRATGRLESVLRELASEFKLHTLEDAEKALRKLQKQSQDAETAYQNQKATFLKVWGEFLYEEG